MTIDNATNFISRLMLFVGVIVESSFRLEGFLAACARKWSSVGVSCLVYSQYFLGFELLIAFWDNASEFDA